MLCAQVIIKWVQVQSPPLNIISYHAACPLQLHNAHIKQCSVQFIKFYFQLWISYNEILAAPPQKSRNFKEYV